MQTTGSITQAYPISNEEYEELDVKFGKLTFFACGQLKRNNSKGAKVYDTDDDAQEVRIAMLRAGSYYKRQTYIESCFAAMDGRVEDKFTRSLVRELRRLWDDRRKHGVGRQRFGPHQEAILERLVCKCVPRAERPDKGRRLSLDEKFVTYCKQIMWNSQKSLAKQISKERSIRSGMVSLSNFDYLAGESF